MADPITLLSVNAFAATHNVSKAAAQKWKAKGYLVLREGKVWVEASDRNLEHSGLGRFATVATRLPKPVATGNPVATPVATPVAIEVATPDVPRDEAGAPDLDDPDTLKTLDVFVEKLLGGTYADLMTASTVKENALALKHVLAAKREAGRLVEVEVAEQVLFEEARAARDAWLNFPARVGTLMAAEVGADPDKLIEALTAHVHRQLEDLGEPDADFAAAAEAADA